MTVYPYEPSGDGLAGVGEKVGLNIRVTNYTGDSLSDVWTEVTSVSNPGVKLSCTIGAMSGMDERACGVSYPVTETDIAAGGLKVQANAFARDASGAVIELGPIPVTMEAAIPRLQMAMNVSDESGDGVADLGERITLTGTVTNAGNTPLQAVEASFRTSGGQSLPTVCPSSSMGPQGETMTCDPVTYEVTQADIDRGQIVFTGVVGGTTWPYADSAGQLVAGTPVEATSASRTLPAGATKVPGLQLKMSVALDDRNRDGGAQPGEGLRYTFQVQNTGDLPLASVRISDPLLSGAGVPVSCPTSEIAPGSSVTCTSGAYVIPSSSLKAGAVTNTATVTALPRYASGAVGASVSATGSVATRVGPSRPRWRVHPPRAGMRPVTVPRKVKR